MKDWLDKDSGFALGKELVRERIKGSALKSSSLADPGFELLRQAILDINPPAAKRSKPVGAPRKRVGAKSGSLTKARPKTAARKTHAKRR